MNTRAALGGPARLLVVLALILLGHSHLAAGTPPEASVRAIPDAVGQHSDALFQNPGTPIGGNRDGDVTLAVFFDYNCGCCRHFARELAAVESIDRGLRVVYLELPIGGTRSALAARAALAAHRQDAYLEFHESLMGSKGYTSPEGIEGIAQTLLLDLDQLLQDMEDPAIGQIIEDNQRLADQLGIRGTPALVLGDRLVQGAIPRDRLADLIDGVRDRTGP